MKNYLIHFFSSRAFSLRFTCEIFFPTKLSWKFTFHCTLKIIFCFFVGFYFPLALDFQFYFACISFTFSYSRNAKFFTFLMTAFGSFLIFIFSLSVVTGEFLLYFLNSSDFSRLHVQLILCFRGCGSRQHFMRWLLFAWLPLLTTFHSQNQVRINYFRFKFIAEKTFEIISR